jgi:DNA-binding Lrp family transcriptional regulator
VFISKICTSYLRDAIDDDAEVRGNPGEQGHTHRRWSELAVWIAAANYTHARNDLYNGTGQHNAGWERSMVTAVVLMNVRADETVRVANELADMDGVSEVFSVAGNYDLVAMLRVKDNEALADLVTTRIRAVAGITQTQTLIAFRAYSRREIESLFDE